MPYTIKQQQEVAKDYMNYLKGLRGRAPSLRAIEDRRTKDTLQIEAFKLFADLYFEDKLNVPWQEYFPYKEESAEPIRTRYIRMQANKDPYESDEEDAPELEQENLSENEYLPDTDEDNEEDLPVPPPRNARQLEEDEIQRRMKEFREKKYATAPLKKADPRPQIRDMVAPGMRSYFTPNNKKELSLLLRKVNNVPDEILPLLQNDIDLQEESHYESVPYVHGLIYHQSLARDPENFQALRKVSGILRKYFFFEYQILKKEHELRSRGRAPIQPDANMTSHMGWFRFYTKKEKFWNKKHLDSRTNNAEEVLSRVWVTHADMIRLYDAHMARANNPNITEDEFLEEMRNCLFLAFMIENPLRSSFYFSLKLITSMNQLEEEARKDWTYEGDSKYGLPSHIATFLPFKENFVYYGYFKPPETYDSDLEEEGGYAFSYVNHDKVSHNSTYQTFSKKYIPYPLDSRIAYCLEEVVARAPNSVYVFPDIHNEDQFLARLRTLLRKDEINGQHIRIIHETERYVDVCLIKHKQREFARDCGRLRHHASTVLSEYIRGAYERPEYRERLRDFFVNGEDNYEPPRFAYGRTARMVGKIVESPDFRDIEKKLAIRLLPTKEEQAEQALVVRRQKQYVNRINSDERHRKNITIGLGGAKEYRLCSRIAAAEEDFPGRIYETFDTVQEKGWIDLYRKLYED